MTSPRSSATASAARAQSPRPATQPAHAVEITVLNKWALSDPLPGVTRVNVMRPTPLGNPFVIGRDGNRDEVVAKYRRWLHANLRTPEVRLALHDLLTAARQGPLELVCCCAPKACHADVIRRCLLWLDDTYEANRE